MLDHTMDLQKMFAAAKLKAPLAPTTSAAENPRSASDTTQPALAPPQLLKPAIEASRTLDAMCTEAVAHSQRRVAEALDQIDECIDTPDVTASLLLAEAELLSASVAVSNFQQSLKSVADRMVSASVMGTWAIAGTALKIDHKTNWLAAVMFGSSDGTSQHPSMSKVSLSYTDLYKHLDEILVILESRVAQELRAALCREELELYESDISFFAKGWASESSYLQSESGSQKGLCEGASSSAQDRSVASGSGTMASSSSATHIMNAARKTEKLLKSTVSSATGSVLDIIRATAATTAAAVAAPSLVLPVAVASSTSSRSARHVGASQDGHFSAEAHRSELHLTEHEIERFELRNEQLLLQQRQRGTNDAKLVETSVRELSQLTSLMNEMVLQQSEQIGILAKNMDEAQANVLGATRELKKPLKKFWTSTKQLILVLWLSTAVVLIAHSLFR